MKEIIKLKIDKLEKEIEKAEKQQNENIDNDDILDEVFFDHLGYLRGLRTALEIMKG